MPQELEAVFNGAVFLPEEALDLASGTRVKLTVEMIPSEERKKPKSFLQTAQSLQLQGEADWSEKTDQYLYGDALRKNGLISR
jgi:predicted DNA-binding antitoxin AbrB/MazE fold protein